MMWVLAVVLVALWALGIIAFHLSGAMIHLLLVAAAIVIILGLIERRPIV